MKKTAYTFVQQKINNRKTIVEENWKIGQGLTP